MISISRILLPRASENRAMVNIITHYHAIRRRIGQAVYRPTAYKTGRIGDKV